MRLWMAKVRTLPRLRCSRPCSSSSLSPRTDAVRGHAWLQLQVPMHPHIGSVGRLGLDNGLPSDRDYRRGGSVGAADSGVICLAIAVRAPDHAGVTWSHPFAPHRVAVRTVRLALPDAITLR
jgi:hypothetical protein